ncbi:hypothetical protein JHK82_028614 [Glycine max]|uniref:Ripening-related protein grip22 n=1 Tax=Glycine soja TaxID=3848 RepID=A0A445IPQ6_GLYSO|nr:hypothetical protein JHK87_028525 [Glycine soja]KAG4997842.1 hypothetical protein JHK85_029281 [Glycine max]KAG5004596.1 hypothetical protein JHK86_028735 [Glycine max]KAG5127779.1 hypothetical protein JHK82_028614 [Glycine max]KAG5152393.1 hypothetical protein JHK84_028865 [Glycine max]
MIRIKARNGRSTVAKEVDECDSVHGCACKINVVDASETVWKDLGLNTDDGLHSPPYNPSGTHATLTLNNFARGGDGGGPAECDGNFHPLPQRVVALSTGWYNHGARCGKMIRIKARNGRSTLAKVVDECDSVHGCDKSHACKTNVVDASKTVWKDLGLNTNDGEVPVTWTMV